MPRQEFNLWWEGRDPSQSDDAAKLARFVNGLPAFDSIYESWLRSPVTKEEVLPVPLSEAAARQILKDKITQKDFGGGPYPELGSAFQGGHAGPPPYDFRKSSYADTFCTIGAHPLPLSHPLHALHTPNLILMRLSEVRSSTGRPWRASELRPLMKFARDIWKPANMSAMFSFHILDLPKIPSPTFAGNHHTLQPWIGWITYLPPELAARADVPGDVEVETLDDGAALVTLCEEPFDKTDAEGMARLHALEAALRPIQS